MYFVDCEIRERLCNIISFYNSVQNIYFHCKYCITKQISIDIMVVVLCESCSYCQYICVSGPVHYVVWTRISQCIL